MGYEFPVEPGRILSFARSVGDLDDIYREQLWAEPGEPVVTPPTFVRSSEHYDPQRALPWHPLEGSEGFSRTDAVHAEQHFEYFAPFIAATRVVVDTLPGRVWHKAGRSGQLEFVETVTEYRDSSGTLLVRATKVSVQVTGESAE